MKKIFAIAFICLTITNVLSCASNKFNIDSDYDGLPDDIDPDPHNNQYRFLLEREKEDEYGEKVIERTKEDIFTIDYRNFFENSSTYNKNLVKLAAIFANEHIDDSYHPVVLNNVYPTESTAESKISPILAQIGGKNIEISNLWTEYKDASDKYDTTVLYQAHNTITYDNKKHQVFFVTIEPYANALSWFSNFDIGCDSNDYKEITGEHSDWSEKKNHKGFDVTANRMKKFVDIYRNKYIDKDAEVVTYITGQSRGGSITNLLGKKLIDAGERVLVYSMNPANTTTESDSAILNKYHTLYSFINRDDFVSRMPLSQWNNYNLYGKKYYYQLANHTREFKDYFGYEYSVNTNHALNEIANFLYSKVKSINDIYKLSEIEHTDGEYYETLDAANNAMESIKSKFDSCLCKEYAMKCFDIYTLEEDGYYYVCWKNRPCLITYALLEMYLGYEHHLDVVQILTNLNGYLALFSDFNMEFISKLMDLMTAGEFSFNGMLCAHLQGPCVLGVEYIE